MSTYYIRCHDCHARWQEHPEEWTAWEKDIKLAEVKLASLNDADA
jgi:SWI/SNF-related matrix-associated actin-dependent regulator of chromatin subfamily A member 5